ncbi:MAG: nucleotide exchange factor GrpE [Planctomycetota bacterium]|jgi:molecular chaperone GrpE
MHEQDKDPAGESSREEDAPAETAEEENGPSSDDFEVDLASLTEADVRDLLERAKAGEERKEALMRLQAEHENYRKRMAREVAAQKQWVLRDFALDTLAVMDDLERALEARAASEAEEAVLEGVRLVYEKLRGILKRYGVRAIEAAGKPFDPAFHEAAGKTPSEDVPPGCVAAELQRGYTLKNLVIRPSRVIVAQAPPKAPAENRPGGDGGLEEGEDEA